MDQLAAMRSFVEVVDRGGFSAAGRVLGLSGPMVGNHVRHLETQLGGRLLNRTTRAQHLTDLGHTYLRRCRNVLAELEAAEADAAAMTGTPRGALRVTAPHLIGTAVLPPIIAAFLRKHAAVSIDLHLEDRRLDMVADRFDVAIRSGALDDSGLLTRALAPTEMLVCASPDYIVRCGEPVTPADLRRHVCLDFSRGSTPGRWVFETAGGLEEIDIAGPLRANSGLALREAALHGLGVVLQPRLLVREAVDCGALVALLPHHRPQSRPLQLLTHPDRHPTPKLRAFVDAVVEVLGA